MNYLYRAMDAAGKDKRGTVDACDEKEAHAKLKNMGLFPIAISPNDGKLRLRWDEVPIGAPKAFNGSRDVPVPHDRFMNLVILLGIVLVAFRTKLGMTYFDLGMGLFIMVGFCWWRAYITTEALRAYGKQTKEKKEKS